MHKAYSVVSNDRFSNSNVNFSRERKKKNQIFFSLLVWRSTWIIWPNIYLFFGKFSDSFSCGRCVPALVLITSEWVCVCADFMRLQWYLWVCKMRFMARRCSGMHTCACWIVWYVVRVRDNVIFAVEKQYGITFSYIHTSFFTCTHIHMHASFLCMTKRRALLANCSHCHIVWKIHVGVGVFNSAWYTAELTANLWFSKFGWCWGFAPGRVHTCIWILLIFFSSSGFGSFLSAAAMEIYTLYCEWIVFVPLWACD